MNLVRGGKVRPSIRQLVSAETKKKHKICLGQDAAREVLEIASK